MPVRGLYLDFKKAKIFYFKILLFDFLAFSFKDFVFGLSGGRPLLFSNCGSCWVIYQSPAVALNQTDNQSDILTPSPT
ncbi:hypothetical protein BpHYR1_028221 [Brachionus plicatilis]|uniref:Uncharacterized protein n=1 Tax=Brachionus plicatilis TaxID=10195 RepID=A0A3M7PAN5_BRAPC|nr:hypothetical protein BpHYR1_028221 [Brachionus plicatilis]